MSSALAAQLAADGFIVGRGVVPRMLCASVRADAMSALHSMWWRPVYNARRLGLTQDWKAIRKPFWRHAIPLNWASSASLWGALGGVARLLLEAGLPRTSQLVELSGAITFPGAAAQPEHTDISPAEPGVGAAAVAPLVTAWLAVQPVLRGAGPTVVIPGSHRRLAARCARINREHTMDTLARAELSMASFEPDLGWSYDDLRAAERRRALNLDVDRELREFGPLPAPQDLVMECGDVAVMDCRIAHFGSAYPPSGSSFWPRVLGSASSSEQAPRVLINATFATGGAGARELCGFTYHRNSDLSHASLANLLQDGATPAAESCH